MITVNECEKLVISFCLQGQLNTQVAIETYNAEENEFNDNELRLIFATCVSLYEQKKEINALQVQNHLKSQGTQGGKLKLLERLCQLTQDIAQDFHFLAQLASVCTAIDTMKKEAKRKKLLTFVQQLHQQVSNAGDLDATLQTGIGELMKLQKFLVCNKNHITLKEAILEARKELETELSGKVIRISTGFSGIDQMIKGLEFGRLYVLAAEEKIGKSLLAGQIALNVAKMKIPVGIVSMEMKQSELAKRFSGASKWQSLETQIQSLEKFDLECSHFPIYFRVGSGTGNQVISTVREMVNNFDVKLVIVDYLQLVDVRGRSDETRVNEINSFVSLLKGMAIDLNIGIILISAVLNKQIGLRRDRKPSPSDLRDSGRIANDCDVLLFLWKPNEDTESVYFELFVSRGREGENGKCGLYLSKDKLKFEETTLREDIPLSEFKSRRFEFT